MLIDEIKKANIQALKDKDVDRRAAFSVAINKCMLLDVSNREKGLKTTDSEVLQILQKLVKELSEEKEMYQKGGNASRVTSTERQLAAISSFLPQMMSESEIKKVIDSLEDKSVKSVMSYFRANYAGRVDLSLVSRLLLEQI